MNENTTKLKERKERYVEWFRGKKEKGEMIQLYLNFKIKEKTKNRRTK